jgi:DNA helicase HerA-like ATPase
MVCGRSGMGKSELMKALLLTVVKARKIVFSFKPNDTHLRLPYPVVDVSRTIPNPFQDADAFSTAYALAFPANLRGIMLSEARAIVKNIAGESKDWNQFRANLKRMEKKATDIQLEALALIEQQTGSLAVGEGSSFSIAGLTKDVVLDFSRLDEAAKTFYAEIALRQIWKSLTNTGHHQQSQP